MRLFFSSFAIWVFALACGGFWASYSASHDGGVAVASLD